MINGNAITKASALPYQSLWPWIVFPTSFIDLIRMQNLWLQGVFHLPFGSDTYLRLEYAQRIFGGLISPLESPALKQWLILNGDRIKSAPLFSSFSHTRDIISARLHTMKEIKGHRESLSSMWPFLAFQFCSWAFSLLLFCSLLPSRAAWPISSSVSTALVLMGFCASAKSHSPPPAGT